MPDRRRGGAAGPAWVVSLLAAAAASVVLLGAALWVGEGRRPQAGAPGYEHTLASARSSSTAVPTAGPSPPTTTAHTMQSIPGLATTYQVVRAGAGRQVVKGSTVTVHATGVVKEQNKKFWSTKDPGQQPFQYQAGVGGVIKGWDQGCLGMQEGEIRKIVIPAAEGYGAGGFPAWGIPAGATLDFEIEILNIQ